MKALALLGFEKKPRIWYHAHNMLNHGSAVNPMGILSGLAERAEKTTPGDVERQYVEPARWLEISAAICKGFEQVLSEKGVEDAGSFLKQTYELFFKAGLRGPCRAALGCMARLADEYGECAHFESTAARELSLPVPFGQISDVQLQVSLAAHELVCWKVAQTLIEREPRAARQLLDTVQELIQLVDVRWTTATANSLWQMHAAASAIRNFCAGSRDVVGTEANLIAYATRYLADFVVPLVEKQRVQYVSAASSLRPLEYGVQAALDEYFDLTFPGLAQEMSRCILVGDSERFLKLGQSVANCIGRLLCRVSDMQEIERSCQRLLSLWRDWGSLNQGASGGHVGALMSAQARLVSDSCIPLMLVIRSTTDVEGLRHLVETIRDFFRNPETKEAQVPASSMAPIRLLCGRMWERIAELEEDADAMQQALEHYLEGCRLLTQAPRVEPFVARDLAASIDRVLEGRHLRAWEQGVVSLLNGRRLLGHEYYSEALKHLTRAVDFLREAIDDPEAQGLRSLTFLTTRACEYASQAAEKLGDQQRSIALLHDAASILEHTARHFKVEASRKELLGEAIRYRKKAAKVANKKGASAAEDPSTP